MSLQDRRGRRLERLPVLAFSVVGVVLVVGVLAATSSTEGQDPPSWYPGSEAVVAPAVDTSSPTTTTTTAPAGPSSTVVDPGPSPVGTAPAATPTSPDRPSAGSEERGETPAPGWHLAARSPAHRGALSDVDVVTGSATETFVAAGADQHGALVLASSGPDAWRALPRDGLPPEGYARAVAATRDAVVVAGADATGAAVWELDGASWRRAAVAGADEGSVVFADLAVRKGIWVLVGFDRQATGFWVRPPGSERFAAVAPRSLAGSATEQMLVRDVVATDEGFVAVGQAGGRAVRWSSTDGVNWDGEPLVTGENATAMGVTADGETVVGYDGVGGVVWTEQAGERGVVRLPAPSGAPQIAETVATRSGHTVVLGVEAGSVRCWEMRDAERPPEACERAAALGSAASIGAVVAHRGGLLGVGQTRGEESGSGEVGVWVLGGE